ncbi:RagB/SusD family nutrient uptake outer membrane protein [Penaeicola halotolerans]|uniref:RagB/SusD family nutrient uptake outer membrane protein n=1 Tax=Penaeicola halotolerans TaxID=2793196 RepID=UPI001CF8275F|nr:RagB/SusD family nutrient uptake outer membrane protein [Penaeicola halotolerans]
MKNNINKLLIGLFASAAVLACNPLDLDDISDPNNPSVESVSNNASREQIQFLITGLEARHRGYVTNVSQAWNTFGREVWYFNGSDPRFQTDWLGQNGRVPDNSYFGFGATGGGSYAAPYQAIKQASVLISAAENASVLTTADRGAVSGFAKTIQGYQFMIPANFVYDNGIRIDVDDPLNPGPYVSYQEALTYAKGILDDGAADLAAASGDFPFRLTPGFTGFTTNAALRQVNRAIAARISIYREQWQDALDALDESFMDLDGDLNAGPSHPYGAPPDAFNPLFYPRNAATNTIIVVHPSMLDDALPGDTRVAEKFFERDEAVTISSDGGTLTATHQDNRWGANTEAIPFIRNEELILIKAEAHARLNQFTESVEAINVIRNAAGLGDYTGTVSQEALIDEILFQRRYSLWAEPWGHRWIDARRYNRLSDIPTSYDNGVIFRQFPHPQSELNWDDYTGN